jgi:hypothetical protein
MYINTALKKIRLSVVWHLGCFHRLAAVNNAAINMGVEVPLLKPDGVLLLNHMAVLFSIMKRCLVFSHVLSVFNNII